MSKIEQTSFQKGAKTILTVSSHERVFPLSVQTDRSDSADRGSAQSMNGDCYSSFRHLTNYSQTSMARTSLRQWKFVRDMDSSSHLGLIMAPCQDENDDNLGKPFRSSTQ